MFARHLILIISLILHLSTNVHTIAPTNIDLLDPALFQCTCDLTTACDLNCCCDTTCSESDKTLFRPVCQSKTRGLINKDIDAWYCNDIFGNIRLQEPNWFPIMCVNSVTSVLLGKFYSPYDIDRFVSGEGFVAKIEEKIKESYNYRSGFINDITNSNTLIRDSRYCTLNSIKQYTYGTCVKLTVTFADTQPSRFLAFPQSLSDLSTCNYNSPVRYLINTGKSACPITIDQYLSFCTASSPVNYETYSLTNLLIKNPKINAKTDVVVEFLKCDAYTTASDPTSNLQANSVLSCRAPDGTTCVFNSNAKLFDYEVSGLCAASTWTYSPGRINNIPLDFSSKLFSKCVLVPSNQIINSPEKLGNRCLNTVISVKNLFFWKEGEISRVVTQIVLADIEYQGSIQHFKQRFELDWVYEATSPLDTTAIISVANYSSLLESKEYVEGLNTGLRGVQVNGSKVVSGYIDGNIIISGYRLASSDLTIPVDITYNQRISTYKILNGKLCGLLSNLERVQIKFNENLSSSCKIRLTPMDLSNRCSCLKNLIFNKLNDYFAPSNYVSKNGNPDMTQFNDSDWLSIYPLSRTFNNTLEDDLNGTNLKGLCSNVPYKMVVHFLFAKVGKASGTDYNEIIGTKVSYVYRDWRFICKLEDKEKCVQANHLQDFGVEFEAKFTNTTYKNPNPTFIEKCQADSDYSEACIQQALFVWPRDYRDPDFFYLYTVQLGLIFGAFALMIVYVMLFGMVCAC